MKAGNRALIFFVLVGTHAVLAQVSGAGPLNEADTDREEVVGLGKYDEELATSPANPSRLMVIPELRKARTTMMRRRPRLKGGGARSECSCIGDPHCKPFCGNFFDIHYIGVFRVAKIGMEEVQMATYTCNRKQKWSGGLSVKCNKAIGVRVDGQNVFTVHKNQGSKYNGKRLTGCKRLGKVAFCGRGTTGMYIGSTMKARIKRQNFRAGAMCIYVSLKGGAKSSQTTGVCGSGCGKLYNGRGGGKFPCKNCRTGVGVWGGICPCKEHMTTNQIFTNKFRIPVKQPPIKKPAVDKRRLRRLTDGCTKQFRATPFGKLAWQHARTRRLAVTLAKQCGLDRYTSKKQGNKNAMEGNVCTSVRMMVRKSKTDMLLCKILAKCGSKSKKCILEKKRTPGKFMERKRRVVVNPVKTQARGGGGGISPCDVKQKGISWCNWAGWSDWHK
jgi:hypothetical protein